MFRSQRRLFPLAVAVAASAACGPSLAQTSWVFAPAPYTHNPMTGVRTTRYAPDAWVEPLDDPRQTVSRYSRTTSNRFGADGSSDQIIEVQSFGNTRGGYDAQRERGFDASLQTLEALEPFRRNPFLFFGGLQGFGYGFPGLPAAPPYGGFAAPPAGYTPPAGYAPPHGAPYPAQDPNAPQAPYVPHPAAGAGAAAPPPPVGQPGTAYPYQPQTGAIVPVAPIGPFWGGFPAFGPGFGHYPGAR
ncbi:hypothetical protein [Botrimarina sp.]|uniref:hypothetical protein n=1 Tax=Botrimarina sp. TaxID=2795802 RepID=UPI0032EC8A28